MLEMQKRKLGNSELDVAALGFGCMRMSLGDMATDKMAVGIGFALVHQTAYPRAKPLS
jgi:aryl-alcohol dehydrogenase-like predicted oxidoreductase